LPDLTSVDGETKFVHASVTDPTLETMLCFCYVGHRQPIWSTGYVYVEGVEDRNEAVAVLLVVDQNRAVQYPHAAFTRPADNDLDAASTGVGGCIGVRGPQSPLHHLLTLLNLVRLSARLGLR